MNAFNRIIMILLQLALGVLIFLVLIYPGPEYALALAQAGLQVASTSLSQFRADPATYQAGRLIAAIIGLVVILLLLALELRRPQRRSVQLPMRGGTTAQLTTDSIARKLAYHIDQLADIIAVNPEVVSRGKTVDVTLNLETSPEVDVPMKTEEVIAVAREVVTERMGLQMGRLSVHMRQAPYDQNSRV